VAMLSESARLAGAECPVFNGGSGIAVPVRDMVALLSESLQRRARVGFSGIRRRGDPVVLVADTGRIAAAGMRCRIPLRLGVQRYADWFKLARNE
jgi:nucleoside-diphosphate-sugar epimerase